VDKLLRRTLVTIVLLSIVWVTVYHLPIWMFCLIVAVFIGLAQFEFFKMVEKRGIFVYKYFGTIIGVLLPVVIFIGYRFSDINNLEPMLIMLSALFVFVLQFLRVENGRDHLVSMGITVFGILYISWFFSFFIKLRFLPEGAGLVAFLIIVTKGADIGAYLGGSRFGKNELMPRISPNKTKEGTLCGVLLGLIIAILSGQFLAGFTVLQSIFLGVTLSVLGQIGDLAESLIKRDCRVKDSAPYLADIGGVFDVIDSLLFTAPVFYFYVKSLV
jgi:phosphatidate cytidylyltransferase